MKVKELRERSIDELRVELLSLAKELFSMRMRRGAGQSMRPHLFRQVRRDIARVKTLMTEKSKQAGE